MSPIPVSVETQTPRSTVKLMVKQYGDHMELSLFEKPIGNDARGEKMITVSLNKQEANSIAVALKTWAG